MPETERSLPAPRFPITPGLLVLHGNRLELLQEAVFAWLERRYKSAPGSAGHSLWVESQEPIAAGIVAGAALMGIGDQLISVFVLGS